MKAAAALVLCLGLAGCYGAPPSEDAQVAQLRGGIVDFRDQVDRFSARVSKLEQPRPNRHFRTRASWYGYREAGCRTASGEIFDPGQLTAAHRSLPFGTLVLVTNLKNGLQVCVEITDRGPYKPGRGVDLSKAAAIALDMVLDGVVPVDVEILG